MSKQVPGMIPKAAQIAPDQTITNQIEALVTGRLENAFELLGPHRDGKQTRLRTYHPGAISVEVLAASGESLGILDEIGASGLFVGVFNQPLPPGYVLNVSWASITSAQLQQHTEDPYAFDLLLGELDLHLIAEGKHWELGRCLGAQTMSINGIAGTRFAVWAPNARRVAVIGDFNNWDGRRHPMRFRHSGGVWELFIPRVTSGTVYKYQVIGVDGTLLADKADPIARMTELPPRTGSVVAASQSFVWTDSEWLARRAQKQLNSAPLSIYEVHAGSWLRILEENGRSLSWDELADRLIPYVIGMGFTHVQFMPVMEHPFGGSWGYQPLAQFAPSARFGPPESFARFINLCHNAGLGVILDWVPAHFPSDNHGLAHFDGTALYEHQDPREGYHPEWNTYIYNLGRNEVRGFLVASALEWLEHYHIDGLRIDAVASMLYRDYSRKPGEWVPNVYGGRENLEAVDFLRALNQAVHERCPDALMIAEDSTAWPGVTKPVEEGGLGFSYKWNMGWMHDTLDYMQTDPIYRQYRHNALTFGLMYAFSENFVLPISHDEVVYGKRSLLSKMPGDDWQRRANLRAYLGFMWTQPGKKLLFMGCEIGQYTEWNHDGSPSWNLLDTTEHRAIQQLVRDLNRLYVSEPSLHQRDASPDGFEWLVCDDGINSVFAYARKSSAAPLLIVCNMTPVPRTDYVINTHTLPLSWHEVFNSDAAVYGGSNIGNGSAPLNSQASPNGHMLRLTLPPLGVIILKALPQSDQQERLS